jgi:hypothetical protein
MNGPCLLMFFVVLVHQAGGSQLEAITTSPRWFENRLFGTWGDLIEPQRSQ